MNIKEIEEKLKRVKKGSALIPKLQLKYQSLESGLLAGSNQFQTRVKMSKSNNTENKLLDTLELRDKIVEQIQAIMNERLEAMDMINQLEEIEEWLVVTMIYFNNLPMVEICNDLNFSKVQIYRIRKEAIEHLAKEEVNV